MGIGICVCSCAPAISGAVRVVLSFQKWGSAGGGALSCPFPWDENLWSCVGSGARSIPGVAGLCWRGRGLSRLALGHPSPGSHHCCRAGASGLCSLANNTREEAACCRPELTAGAVPSRAHPPPAACITPPGALCARAAAASPCAVLAPARLLPGFPSAVPCIFASG